MQICHCPEYWVTITHPSGVEFHAQLGDKPVAIKNRLLRYNGFDDALQVHKFTDVETGNSFRVNLKAKIAYDIIPLNFEGGARQKRRANRMTFRKHRKQRKTRRT
jgi:hypothetical protein